MYKIKKNNVPVKLHTTDTYLNTLYFSVICTVRNLCESNTVCAKNILKNQPDQHFRRIFKFDAIYTSPNKFLLDWGIGLVIFGADCKNITKI